MGKSENGPDWIDVIGTMQAIETIHSVAVSINISLTEKSRLRGLVVKVTASLRAATNTGRVPSVSRSSKTGYTGKEDMAAHMYGLLLGLDHDCTTMWTQQEFPQSG